VLCADFHRAEIQRELKKDPANYKNVHFCFVSPKFWHYKPSKLWDNIELSILKPVMNAADKIWLKDAYALAKEIHEQVKFDLVHQITYVGFRFSGHLWKLDIPFVWGPIGGLENTPWRFLPVLGIRGCIEFAGRNIINSIHKAFLPGPKKAFKKARGGIIAATEGISKEIQKWYGEQSFVICEIGPPQNIASSHTIRNDGDQLRIAWSGTHTPGKALPILLQALRILQKGVDWHLDIMGIGPCTGVWKALSLKFGLDSRCSWHGLLSREDAMELTHKSHIFVITSMKDLTSTVLLEALSQGVPVICPDHCGFSNVVTEECGFKIPLKSPSQLINGMAQTIQYLAQNEELRQDLARGALKRIRDYSWDLKAEAINSIYKNVLYNNAST
jgi:glycosyltransferase involved in cell wall biosynthesis